MAKFAKPMRAQESLRLAITPMSAESKRAAEPCDVQLLSCSGALEVESEAGGRIKRRALQTDHRARAWLECDRAVAELALVVGTPTHRDAIDSLGARV